MASVAARSVLRSTRSSTTRLAARVKPRAAPSPFRISSQKPLAARILSVSVESMLAFHIATASAADIHAIATMMYDDSWMYEQSITISFHRPRNMLDNLNYEWDRQKK